MRKRGTCASWSQPKGYGLILTESGEQLFCHYTALAGTGYRDLAPGQVVTFVQKSFQGLFDECVSVQEIK